MTTTTEGLKMVEMTIPEIGRRAEALKFLAEKIGEEIKVMAPIKSEMGSLRGWRGLTATRLVDARFPKVDPAFGRRIA